MTHNTYTFKFYLYFFFLYNHTIYHSCKNQKRTLFEAIHYMTAFFSYMIVYSCIFMWCHATKKKRKTLLQKCNRKSLWELVTESHLNVFLVFLKYLTHTQNDAKRLIAFVVVVIMLK